jgi:hypothetical protein
MPLYYQGDVEADFVSIQDHPQLQKILMLTDRFAYGRIQQMLLDPATRAFDRLDPSDMAKMEILDHLGETIGKEEFCRVVQILWARYLKDINIPTSGALNTFHSAQMDAEIAAMRAERRKGLPLDEQFRLMSEEELRDWKLEHKLSEEDFKREYCIQVPTTENMDFLHLDKEAYEAFRDNPGTSAKEAVESFHSKAKYYRYKPQEVTDVQPE